MSKLRIMLESNRNQPDIEHDYRALMAKWAIAMKDPQTARIRDEFFAKIPRLVAKYFPTPKDASQNISPDADNPAGPFWLERQMTELFDFSGDLPQNEIHILPTPYSTVDTALSMVAETSDLLQADLDQLPPKDAHRIEGFCTEFAHAFCLLFHALCPEIEVTDEMLESMAEFVKVMVVRPAMLQQLGEVLEPPSVPIPL